MSEERVWDEAAREDLRNSLRSAVLGELRLARRDHEEIVEACREIYILDECPERECAAFVRFTQEELARCNRELQAEKSTWPEVTDCDRLDRVEAVLRERGILLWQVSPCCDTCSGAELPDRIDEIDCREPGFRDRVRGYTFFIDQNMPQMLTDGPHISVYLAYGWFSPDGKEVSAEEYQTQALAIAREVCQCLHGEGFEVDWDGDLGRKIGISLDWQRRTLLE